MAEYRLPMASQTRASPGPHDAIALYSGESSPRRVSFDMSGRGGMKRRVLARATSLVPGVNDRTSSMKQGSYPSSRTPP